MIHAICRLTSPYHVIPPWHQAVSAVFLHEKPAVAVTIPENLPGVRNNRLQFDNPAQSAVFVKFRIFSGLMAVPA
ncbi:hypothetical protein [Serratia sp. FGI94]|uniref:hypothetical protein n=1 Tax=Serratia sp. FGI94 TaxID=671990 RepID=UPI000F4EFF0F|nr:hypothetical protein [Serratia sp. FGI94]